MKIIFSRGLGKKNYYTKRLYCGIRAGEAPDGRKSFNNIIQNDYVKLQISNNSLEA